jgi:hypothetical protein
MNLLDDLNAEFNPDPVVEEVNPAVAEIETMKTQNFKVRLPSLIHHYHQISSLLPAATLRLRCCYSAL